MVGKNVGGSGRHGGSITNAGFVQGDKTGMGLEDETDLELIFLHAVTLSLGFMLCTLPSVLGV